MVTFLDTIQEINNKCTPTPSTLHLHYTPLLYSVLVYVYASVNVFVYVTKAPQALPLRPERRDLL